VVLMLACLYELCVNLHLLFCATSSFGGELVPFSTLECPVMAAGAFTSHCHSTVALLITCCRNFLAGTVT
jgi:hypothetical protein